MTDRKFRETKFIYDFVKKYPRFFESKPDEVIHKFEQFKRGLPKEDEFISLALWMGNCALIHKLDQNQMPKWTKDHYQVVDLFAVLRNNNRLIPVLIEVKSQESRANKNPKLIFSEAYYRKVTAYARLNKLPLLIAWKVGNMGLWFLVNITNFEQKEKAYHLELSRAMKENLMSLLLGDFSIHFRPGIKFQIECDLKKVEKSVNHDSKEIQSALFEIRKIEFYNYKCEPVHKIPGLLLYMLSLIYSNEEEEITGKKWYKNIEWPDGGTIFASMLHGMACTGFEEIFDPKEIDWNKIIFEEISLLSGTLIE